jgi:hypothetical protein
VIDYAHTRISLALHLLPFNVWFFSPLARASFCVARPRCCCCCCCFFFYGTRGGFICRIVLVVMTARELIVQVKMRGNYLHQVHCTDDGPPGPAGILFGSIDVDLVLDDNQTI